MGRIALVSLWVGLVACSFDSNTDSVGGMSLGDGESSSTGDGGSNTMPTSVSSGSASGGSSATSVDPTPGSTTAEPTSSATQTSNTSPTSDTNAEGSTSGPDSATSNGTTAATLPGTGTATTEPTAEPYAACPGGADAECPTAVEVCRVFEDGDSNILGSFCTETGCGGDGECPAGADGTAVPRCRGMATTFCVLDCEADVNSCPTGMECEHVWIISTEMYEDRCYWPV